MGRAVWDENQCICSLPSGWGLGPLRPWSLGALGAAPLVTDLIVSSLAAETLAWGPLLGWTGRGGGVGGHQHGAGSGPRGPPTLELSFSSLMPSVGWSPPRGRAPPRPFTAVAVRLPLWAPRLLLPTADCPCVVFWVCPAGTRSRALWLGGCSACTHVGLASPHTGPR